jgi:multidrug transporter EmrE-like cation transporter
MGPRIRIIFSELIVAFILLNFVFMGSTLQELSLLTHPAAWAFFGAAHGSALTAVIIWGGDK